MADPPEVMAYMKERDAAREELQAVQKELRQTQGKLYDSMMEVEALEKKLAELGGKKKGTKKTNVKKKPPTATDTVTSSKGAKVPPGGAVRTDNHYHPPIADLEQTCDTRQYYSKLAELFPMMPILQLLEAEQKFIEADVDRSGTIELAELDHVLTASVGMFNPKQLEEIFREVDADGNEELDFEEVLTVVYKIHTGRKINLPQSVKQNYSKTCTIQ